MGSLSDYLENKILDHIFMNTSYTMLANIWVGLSTADPLDDATGLAEPSGGSYARVSTDGAAWDAAASGALDNGTDLTFPTATGSWGIITHFALFDAASAGNMLAHGQLTVSKTVGSGDTVKFAAGDLDVTLD